MIAKQGKPEIVLLKEEYGVRGGDLEWQAVWGSTNVVLTVYERTASQDLTNVLLTIMYQYDPKAGGFSALKSKKLQQ